MLKWVIKDHKAFFEIYLIGHRGVSLKLNRKMSAQPSELSESNSFMDKLNVVIHFCEVAN